MKMLGQADHFYDLCPIHLTHLSAARIMTLLIIIHFG
jgi:hypothetical protein